MFDWDDAKNQRLIAERGISFELVVQAVEKGKVLADRLVHHNSEKYPNQYLMIVEINGYAYNVPFVEQEDHTRFLKTVYPSRTATQKYLLRDTP